MVEQNTEVQELELVEEKVKPATQKKQPDPARELRALKKEMSALQDTIQQQACEIETLRDDYEQAKKELNYARSYNRAAMTNVSDQLTVLQRTVQILTAGGEQ